ncbi:MAG TPA: FHA domain-containing protein [Kofleriaceae bacterium]
MKTVGVDLWGGQVRGGGQNNVTCLRSVDHPGAPVRLRQGFRELFLAAYSSFAERCREVTEPGLALIAIDEVTGKPLGIARLLARVQRHVAAIVGRHDECDLFLNAHARLALRHLAIVLDPVSDWRPGANVRYRVLDLRTTDGFTDENDRPLRGLRCEGAGLLRCGGYALFFLPLGDPSDWPASATDAWQFLPERVYFDELDRSPLGSRPSRSPRGPRFEPFRNSPTQRSLIIRTHGPRDTADGASLHNGDLAGTLELVGPKHRGTIKIGHDELRDGVLLGRYARCNNAQIADDPSLSRVHALLLQVDDAILIVDTASLNGIREADQPKARLITLAGDTELVLGTATRARWHWVS